MITIQSKELTNQAKKEIKELLGKFPEYLLVTEVLSIYDKGMLSDTDLEEILGIINEYYAKENKKS